MPGTYSKHKSGEELANCNFQDLENPWTFHALFLQNNYLVIRWLQRNGLLVQSWKCEICMWRGLQPMSEEEKFRWGGMAMP